MGKAIGSGNTGQLRRPYGVKGNSQEGFNRRGARNLMHMRIHIHIGEALVESQAQSDEDLTFKDIGTAYKKGGHKLG